MENEKLPEKTEYEIPAEDGYYWKVEIKAKNKFYAVLARVLSFFVILYQDIKHFLRIG